MDPIVDNPECMEAYGRIIECLYSSPSQETSTIFKLLSCLPAITIDIEERSDFLQDLYNEVKQKMMNMADRGTNGVNWNQVIMNLQTIMHRVESNQGMNEGMNEMWDDRDEYANWNDIRNEYGYEPAPMIQYDEEGYPIKYGPQDLEEQDPSTISAFTKKMWEIERKRRMKN